jgi:hypothetical protein
MGKHSSRKLQLEQASFKCSALMTGDFSTADLWGVFNDGPLMEDVLNPRNFLFYTPA